ncbi:MAG: AAA family ATPase [Ruminiclostridium sp.]|nr:AAA family ATPase [Ruminiclostridium sp.]
MVISGEAVRVIEAVIAYAKEKRREYVTPEMLLLKIINADDTYMLAFRMCGGDDKALERDVEDYVNEYIDESETGEPEFSEGINEVFAVAARSAMNSSKEMIEIPHLLHGICSQKNSYASYFLERQGIREADLLRDIASVGDSNDEEDDDISDGGTDHDDDESGNTETERGKSRDGQGSELFAPCLNDTLKDADPLIGREYETDRTIQILCRRDKNNPLHIGEPGVGKTAITYGLVEMIRSGSVPEPLKGAKIYALDLGGMLAGTRYRGDFEKRFKKVLADIGREDKPIIYIDEIHNLAGAGAVGESSFDASNLLKPYLADGHIRFIGATTFEEYKRYFEKNKSLVRRFQNVEIKEPTEDEAVKILQGLKPRYEKFHGVTYSDDVIEYAVKMSSKHIHERFLPDKAIDLIDEAGSYRKLHPGEDGSMTVDKPVINEVLTKICRVPVETVETEEVSELAALEENMKARIFGQDEAVSQVVNAVKFSKAGLLEENKPLASLLFVGPTGVGKTEIAKCLAELLGVKLVRFDMSEYSEKHSIAKLIGSPAGYVGYEDGGLLTEAIRKNPSAVLLLDEIEKADPGIYNILLQIMDYATLTDNQGRKADFRNVALIMTSNAGASLLGKSALGFGSPEINAGAIDDAVKRTFQPEFRNRLNRIIRFNGMNDDMAARIVDKKLGELAKQLAAKDIEFTADDSAKALIRKKGISREFGARETDRVLGNEVKPLFVDEILFGTLKNGGRLMLSANGESFEIKASRKE